MGLTMADVEEAGKKYQREQELLHVTDVTAPEYIEVIIATDGKTVWINNEVQCLFRACKIKKLLLDDRRKP